MEATDAPDSSSWTGTAAEPKSPSASDPRAIGWMHGFPPPPSKRITFGSDTFFDFPQRRWSLSHMREVLPTINVRRGPAGPSPFPRHDESAAIDGLTFVDLDGHARRFVDSLVDTYTDGIVVLHQGRIVYERYFGALEAHIPHDCQSVTKSYVGTLAASFVHEGALDETKTIRHYLPETEGSGWEDATLRHVMDMQTGVAFSEDYLETGHSSWQYVRASNRRARPAGYDGPPSLYDYLPTVPKGGIHGAVFDYKSVNTEVIAWVLSRVSGTSLAQLLHERLWVPLGCEEDGYISVDPAGMPLAAGGLSVALRDLARFGEMMRREGEWNGRQLIPAAVVDDLRRSDHPARPVNEAGYSYRSQWWIPQSQPYNELGAFEAIGRWGQRIYVAPKAEMVVARFSSQPTETDGVDHTIVTPQLLALGRFMRS